MTVKERPILFSGEMVKAILDGRKTQTRRVVKPQPDGAYRVDYEIRSDPWPWFVMRPNGKEVRCPYGVLGDRLWVREAWATAVKWDGYRPDDIDPTSDVIYQAGENDPRAFALGKWRPSILMPRWASRLTLEVTEVRVERLQDISEEDAKAEGINAAYAPGADEPTYLEGAGGFRYLWDSINGKKHPWSSNPWLWVVSFKVV